MRALRDNHVGSLLPRTILDFERVNGFRAPVRVLQEFVLRHVPELRALEGVVVLGELRLLDEDLHRVLFELGLRHGIRRLPVERSEFIQLVVSHPFRRVVRVRAFPRKAPKHVRHELMARVAAECLFSRGRHIAAVPVPTRAAGKFLRLHDEKRAEK